MIRKVFKHSQRKILASLPPWAHLTTRCADAPLTVVYAHPWRQICSKFFRCIGLHDVFNLSARFCCRSGCVTRFERFHPVFFMHAFFEKMLRTFVRDRRRHELLVGLKVLWLPVKNKKFGMLFFIWVCLAQPVYPYAAAFVEKGYAPRPAALGYAYTGLADDSHAIYFNPAGMAFSRKTEVSAMTYTAYETNYTGVQGIMDFDTMQVGFGYIGASVSGILGSQENATTGRYELDGSNYSYNGSALYVGISKFISQQTAIGVSLKRIQESLCDKSAWGVGVDVGGMYMIQDYWTVGAVYQNLLPVRMMWNTGSSDEIPSCLKVGSSIYLFNYLWLITCDMAMLKNTGLQLLLGTEYTINDYLKVRAGHDGKQLIFGMGLTAYQVLLDFSYTTLSNIFNETEYRLSLGYRF